MNPTTQVIKQEHANGTFDVIFRNNAIDDVTLMTDDDRLVWINLLAAIASGVNNLVIHDSYRDKADHDKGIEFIELMDSTLEFSKLLEHVCNNSNGLRLQKVAFADALAALYRSNVDQFRAFLAVLESVHMSGSIVAKDDTTQLRGLVTITYRKGESALKVRLSGAIEESVGLRLREPYLKAVELKTIEVISAPPKDNGGALAKPNGSNGSKPSTGHPPGRERAEKLPKQADGKARTPTASKEVVLSEAQLEDLAERVMRKILLSAKHGLRDVSGRKAQGSPPRQPSKGSSRQAVSS